ncbi:MAG TPA: hypothetical protein VFJ51_09760 [Nitrososphaeraceae archaeon]|nr:hypothetical protein [Nitrososphaeraceae archaeon]
MSDIISWDKAIDMKVKSSDNKDLGKIQSITKDYIQTKEGLVSKNYYFIPKYHIQGYDGDKLWVSLTKDDVKARFEKEKAPDPSEFDTPEYNQRKTNMVKQYPDFENNIPPYSGSGGQETPSTSTPATTSQDMVGLPWENVIDKTVKSSDNQDIGKVESVSTYYLESKEGHVSKKHYYIPKYYVQGFDGKNLHTSLTKDEIKNRYERDSPPSESEFKTQEYEEHKSKIDATHPQFRFGVPFMAKEPGVALESESTGQTLDIPWEEVIHKRVRTTDDIDIGDIETVGNEFIVVREGDVKIHHYYIPKSYITNYDGSSLTIDAPSGLVSGKFERETEPTPEEIKTMSEELPKRKRTAKAGQSADEGEREYEEGAAGTESRRKEDPLKEYREKEPMTPAKIAEHEPTAVKREMTEKITGGGKEVPNPEAAKERARRSGMAKGTAGDVETGSEYEQGAAGSNK